MWGNTNLGISRLSGDISASQISTGTFQDVVKAASNNDYSTPQLRNVMFLSDEPTDNLGNDGDICIVFDI